MWRDQSDCSICNQCCSRITNAKCLTYALAGCQMWKIYFTSVCDRDDKAIVRLMVSAKQTLLDSKSRLAFKFKWETAQTLKIYFVEVCGSDNKTIVQTMASVKQTILDSKSRIAFEFKREELVQKPRASNYCIPLRQLVHKCYQTPFRVHIGGWVTRLISALAASSCCWSWAFFSLSSFISSINKSPIQGYLGKGQWGQLPGTIPTLIAII